MQTRKNMIAEGILKSGQHRYASGVDRYAVYEEWKAKGSPAASKPDFRND